MSEKETDRSNTQPQYAQRVLAEDTVLRDDSIRLRESEAEQAERSYRELRNAFNNSSVLMMRLNSVEVSDDGKSLIYRTSYKSIRDIVIEEGEYFTDTFRFGEDYESLDEKQKFARRRELSIQQLGAVIHVVVTKCRRRAKDRGIGYDYDVKVSRKQGMISLARKWFTDPDKVKVMDIADAYVMMAHQDGIWVSCLGRESYIRNWELSYSSMITNATDHFQSGDNLKVMINKKHSKDALGNPLKPEETYLSLSVRDYESRLAKENLKKMKLYQTFSGVVAGMNKAKQTYTVTLANGVIAAVDSYGAKGRYLTRGQQVIVQVTAIRDEYVIGVLYR